MKKYLYFVIFILFFISIGFADEIEYREINTAVGYRFYSYDGFLYLVGEYEPARSSPYFSLIYKDLSPNNKIIFDALIKEKDDRDIELSITHKDSLHLDFNNINLVHNLDHKKLLYDPQIYDLNPITKYKLDFSKNSFLLKYKLFNYPLHLRFYIEDIERDGTVQKRFYGSRSLDISILSLPPAQRNNIFSRDRQIGFETEKVMGTIDGVLGGIGFVGEIMSENFSNKHHNSPDYLLNYPGINKSAYELRLYSNLTGQVSWAIALNRKDAKNHNRDEIGREGARVTQNDTVAAFTYYPRKNLKLTLKVGYTDREQEGPDTVRFLNNDNVGIKDAISFVQKTADLSGFYELSPLLIFKLNVKRKEVERNFNYFTLPEYSHTNTGIFTVEGKFKKGFSYKISQKVENNHNPAYKKMPEMAYATTLNLNYDFNNFSGIYLQSEYISGKNDTENTYFVSSKEFKQFLNCWFELKENLSLNLYGFYNNERFVSNIQYGNTSPTFIYDKNVPFTFTLYQGGINMNKAFKKHNVYSDISYIRGFGTYYPHFIAGTATTAGPPPVTYTFNTIGLDSLANLDFYQYRLLVGNVFEIDRKSKLKVEASLSDHIDRTRQSIEGTIKMIFLSWELKW